MCEPKKIAEAKRWANRKQTNALMFRKTNAWTNKSIDIRKRDNYMCLCCVAQMVGTVTRYNTRNLSVHHITPIEEDYGKRLDDDNLITVCDVHHEMCEADEITREQQRELAWQSIESANNIV